MHYILDIEFCPGEEEGDDGSADDVDSDVCPQLDCPEVNAPEVDYSEGCSGYFGSE